MRILMQLGRTPPFIRQPIQVAAVGAWQLKCTTVAVSPAQDHATCEHDTLK